MKKTKESNESKTPKVKIDKKLGKYTDKILFKKKLVKANEILERVGIPKNLDKSKA